MALWEKSKKTVWSIIIKKRTYKPRGTKKKEGEERGVEAKKRKKDKSQQSIEGGKKKKKIEEQEEKKKWRSRKLWRESDPLRFFVVKSKKKFFDSFLLLTCFNEGFGGKRHSSLSFVENTKGESKVTRKMQK